MPPRLTEDQKLVAALALIAAFSHFFYWISPGPLPPGYEEELVQREWARQDSVRAADSLARP